MSPVTSELLRFIDLWGGGGDVCDCVNKGLVYVVSWAGFLAGNFPKVISTRVNSSWSSERLAAVVRLNQNWVVTTNFCPTVSVSFMKIPSAVCQVTFYNGWTDRHREGKKCIVAIFSCERA
jgi:hypothetical protein